jgi:hypothetical protein
MSASPPALIRLNCEVKNYDWGKKGDAGFGFVSGEGLGDDHHLISFALLKEIQVQSPS